MCTYSVPVYVCTYAYDCRQAYGAITVAVTFICGTVPRSLVRTPTTLTLMCVFSLTVAIRYDRSTSGQGQVPRSHSLCPAARMHAVHAWSKRPAGRSMTAPSRSELSKWPPDHSRNAFRCVLLFNARPAGLAWVGGDHRSARGRQQWQVRCSAAQGVYNNWRENVEV